MVTRSGRHASVRPSDERIMMATPESEWVPEEFNFPARAIQDTDWISNPANPVGQQTGRIQQHESVWFRQDPFGSGPVWQPARLADNTLCCVQPRHFQAVTPQTEAFVQQLGHPNRP